MSLALVAGFVVSSLAPSFLEWEDHPDKRGQIALYYAVAIGLIAYGLRRR